MNLGIQFAIATGRHDSMIKSYLKHLNLEVPVISCNGAMVREPFSGQVLLSEASPKEQSLNVIDLCKERNVDFHIYGHDSIFGENLSHKMLYYNDIDLIEYAGLGIAVANAEEALKEKADMVTNATNNEDAVSEAIE